MFENTAKTKKMMTADEIIYEQNESSQSIQYQEMNVEHSNSISMGMKTPQNDRRQAPLLHEIDPDTDKEVDRMLESVGMSKLM